MDAADTRIDDLVARTEGVQPWRRVFHASSGLLAGLGPGWLGLERTVTLAILAGLLLIAVTLDFVRLRMPAANRTFFRIFQLVASPREARGVASSTWFVLGALIAHALFPAPYAAAGLVVLALADPSASVVGRIWGTVPLGKGSVQGTTVFALVAWGVLWMLLGQPLRVGSVAVGVALMEVVPDLVDDNLVVPLTTGALLWLVLGTPA